MIDYDRLEALKPQLTEAFASAAPFRWFYMDGFLKEESARRLHAEFGEVIKRSNKDPEAAKKHKHVLRKIGIMRTDLMNAIHVHFFEEIQSPEFLSVLQEITGIRPLYADPALNGGGLHEIYAGGYLNVHTDFNFHPDTGHHRKLNILYYLNPDWDPAWDGDLELWPETMSEPFARITPLFNRMAIFETGETSFHGHPKPLKAPPGVTRRSLATYYYSDWPDGLERRAKTNYKLVPWQRQALTKAIQDLRLVGTADDEIIDRLSATYQPADIAKVMRKVPASI